jgi:cysteine-S-conjugate beta-lyase
MSFDFDTPIDRRGTASYKWELYGPDVLPLWVADMDFASPPAVVAALERRAAHGVFGYSLVPRSLVEAIRTHLLDRFGWRIEEEWLVWLPSVVPGLDLACRAFAGDGEGVLTLTPVYPPFLRAPGEQGRRLVTVPVKPPGGGVVASEPPAHGGVVPATDWRFPLDDLEAAITPDSRLLLFCHPHNPIGRVWRRDEVAAVVEFCRRRGLVLCSDEIHADLLLDDLGHVPSVLAHPDAAALTVTLFAPSKTFNLPGLNFAFAVISDAELRRRFREAAAGLLPFPGCFAIAAAEAAYSDGIPWLEELLVYLCGNRDLLERFVAERLPRVSVTHVEATYLAWLDVRALGLADPGEACRRAGVALSNGADFGTPGFLRLNFACPRSTLVEALERIAAVLA